MEYQKINSLFKRDANNIIIPSQFTLPEFEYLKDTKFECTEKIDGTNMRIEITTHRNPDGAILFTYVDYKGRTDRAIVPTHLFHRMSELFDNVDWFEIFPSWDGETITIFGEGYGKKIQDGGNYIKDGVDFILFDVRIGNWWLNRKACEDIANKLGIKIVPIIGYMTIKEAMDFVKMGFKSTISENKEYEAEGLVLKTPDGLLRRNGERIITKIKTIDFIKFKRKYGDEENPVQPVNPKYN